MDLKTNKYVILFLCGLLCVATVAGFVMVGKKDSEKPIDYITIAILAKDKAHTLPIYLATIENQTWPKEKTYLYVRTNNNNDDTQKILKNWLEKVGPSYAKVYFDDKDVEEPIQQYTQHEWNSMRFKVLGKIRQDSIDWARENGSHYFVVDCDNFVHPHTLESLAKTNLQIVAPFLKLNDHHYYSNYHAAVDKNGYLASTPHYYDYFNQVVRGLIEVPVVHCSYFIRHDALDKLTYDDDSYRYEYVIFSDSARKQRIPQYLDNREVYGRITFAENLEAFDKEPWIHEFDHLREKTPIEG